MKKVMVSLSVLVMLIFLTGCLDYKAYDVPKKEDNVAKQDLVDEIAEIEKQLELEENELDEIDVVGEEMLNDDLVTSKENAKADNPEEALSETTLNETTNTDNEKNVNGPPPATENEKKEEEIILPELDQEKVTDKTNLATSNEDVQVINVKENELVKLNVKVTDPDQDNVTYTFTKPLNNKGEWKTNYGDVGEYLVTLTATDKKLTSEKKIKIVVERVNVPPVIEKIKDIIVSEGKTVKFEPKVSDPNGDPITVTVSEPLKSGNFVTDHTSAGEYQIKVLASDGELEAEKTFKLTVNNVNVLPEIKGLKDLVVKEGDTVSIKPDVTDLDGDKLTLTISEPVGNDGVWETSYVDHGEYVVTVTADDGKDKVTKKVKIKVEDVNMPPDIVEVTVSVR